MRSKLMILGLAGLVGQVLAGGVFFSEYAEGSSNNKALEIYNGTDMPITMADYAVWRISNGGDWVEGQGNDVVFADLTTELITDLVVEAGETFVIVNSSAMPEMQAVADVIGTSACWFNGDDAMGLAHSPDAGVTWNLIDAIGEEGADPGSGWTVSGTSNGTANHTIVRLPSFTEGNTSWLTCQDEWQVFPSNTIDDLGQHTVAGGGNLPPIIGLVTMSPEAPTDMDVVDLTAAISDADGTVADAFVMYHNFDFTITDVIGMSNNGDGTWTTLSSIPAFPACEQVFYSVEAMDDEGALASSMEYDYTVFCLYTIAEVQGGAEGTPFEGQDVTVEGYVTAIATSGARGFFLQDAEATWSGIQVYTGSTPDLAIGDHVQVTGEATEYNGQTELVNPSYFLIDTAQHFYAPLSIYASEATEAYESVLISVVEGYCADPDLGYGEWLLGDDSGEVRVDDWFVSYPVELDHCYNVQGILYYSYGNFKIEPVVDGDITSCDVVDANELASSFELNGNYPNPFNPTTQIAFSMDLTAQASLIVFDIMGREVATLINGMVDAGEHQVTFDASYLSSGIYFYQLNSQGRSLTSRMLLVR
jgi:hypothetical protein